MNLSEYPPVESFTHVEMSSTATPFEDIWGRKRKYVYGRSRVGISQNFHAFFGELHDNTYIRRYGPAYGTASMLADEADININSSTEPKAENFNFDDIPKTEKKTKHFATEDQWDNFVYNCIGTVSFLTPKNQNASPCKLNLVNVESAEVRRQKLKWRKICQQKKRQKKEEEKQKSFVQNETSNNKISDSLDTLHDYRSDQNSSYGKNKKEEPSLKDILSKVDIKNTKSTLFESSKRLYEMGKHVPEIKETTDTFKYKEKKRTSNYNNKFRNTTKLFDKQKLKELDIFAEENTYLTSNILTDEPEEFSERSNYNVYVETHGGRRYDWKSKNSDNKVSKERSRKITIQSNICDDTETYRIKNDFQSKFQSTATNTEPCMEQGNKKGKKVFSRKSPSSNIIPELQEFQERRHDYNLTTTGTNTEPFNENNKGTKKFSRKSPSSNIIYDDEVEFQERKPSNSYHKLKNSGTNTYPLNELYKKGEFSGKTSNMVNELFEPRNFSKIKDCATNTEPFHEEKKRKKKSTRQSSYSYEVSAFNREKGNSLNKLKDAGTNTEWFNDQHTKKAKRLSKNSPFSNIGIEDLLENSHHAKFKDSWTNTEPSPEPYIKENKTGFYNKSSNFDDELHEEIQHPVNKKHSGTNTFNEIQEGNLAKKRIYEYNKTYGYREIRLEDYNKFKNAATNTDPNEEIEDLSRKRTYPSTNDYEDDNAYGYKGKKHLNRSKFKSTRNAALINEDQEENNYRNQTSNYFYEDCETYGYRENKQINKFKSVGTNTESSTDLKKKKYASRPSSNFSQDGHLNDHCKKYKNSSNTGRLNDEFSGKSSNVCEDDDTGYRNKSRYCSRKNEKAKKRNQQFSNFERDDEQYDTKDRNSSKFMNVETNTHILKDIFARHVTYDNSTIDNPDNSSNVYNPLPAPESFTSKINEIGNNLMKKSNPSNTYSRRGALMAKVRSVTNKTTQPTDKRQQTRRSARSGRSWGARNSNEDFTSLISSAENWAEENLGLATNFTSQEDNNQTYIVSSTENWDIEDLDLTTHEEKQNNTSDKSDSLKSSIKPYVDLEIDKSAVNIKSFIIEDSPEVEPEGEDYHKQDFANNETTTSKICHTPPQDPKKSYKFLEMFGKNAISRRYVRGRRVWNGSEYTEDEASYRPFLESLLASSATIISKPTNSAVEKNVQKPEASTNELQIGIANMNLAENDQNKFVTLYSEDNKLLESAKSYEDANEEIKTDSVQKKTSVANITFEFDAVASVEYKITSATANLANSTEIVNPVSPGILKNGQKVYPKKTVRIDTDKNTVHEETYEIVLPPLRRPILSRGQIRGRRLLNCTSLL